jgi:uncharacterized glyoxalase superfamily protein PhnB
MFLEMDSQEEIYETYSRLTDKGTVHIQILDTFWSAKYAKSKDLYGMTRNLNFQKQKGTHLIFPQEKVAAATFFFLLLLFS